MANEFYRRASIPPAKLNGFANNIKYIETIKRKRFNNKLTSAIISL